MEMDLYKSSRAVGTADAHLISAYSFSIVEIVHEKLKKKTIHLGQACRLLRHFVS